MPKFMALYVGSPEALARSGWDRLDEQARRDREARGMAAWGQWQEKNQVRAVDGGGPLGKTKRVDARGIRDASNNVAGYIIVEAESHEAAARLFIDHPHFTIFPGEAVEIMPCLPIPAG